MKTSAEYFHLAVGPRSGSSRQKGAKTYLTYDTSHKKKQNPKPNNYFSLQTRGLAESFSGLNSFLVQLSAEIFLCKNTCELLDFSFSLLEWKVLMHLIVCIVLLMA